MALLVLTASHHVGAAATQHRDHRMLQTEIPQVCRADGTVNTEPSVAALAVARAYEPNCTCSESNNLDTLQNFDPQSVGIGGIAEIFSDLISNLYIKSNWTCDNECSTCFPSGDCAFIFASFVGDFDGVETPFALEDLLNLDTNAGASQFLTGGQTQRLCSEFTSGQSGTVCLEYSMGVEALDPNQNAVDQTCVLSYNNANCGSCTLSAAGCILADCSIHGVPSINTCQSIGVDTLFQMLPYFTVNKGTSELAVGSCGDQTSKPTKSPVTAKTGAPTASPVATETSVPSRTFIVTMTSAPAKPPNEAGAVRPPISAGIRVPSSAPAPAEAPAKTSQKPGPAVAEPTSENPQDDSKEEDNAAHESAPVATPTVQSSPTRNEKKSDAAASGDERDTSADEKAPAATPASESSAYTKEKKDNEAQMNDRDTSSDAKAPAGSPSGFSSSDSARGSAPAHSSESSKNDTKSSKGSRSPKASGPKTIKEQKSSKTSAERSKGQGGQSNDGASRRRRRLLRF